MRSFINYAAAAIAAAALAGALSSQARADAYLVSKLKQAERQCERGQPGACTEAREVRGELSSKGWCYGRPSDTLPWQRDKTGWVRCSR